MIAHCDVRLVAWFAVGVVLVASAAFSLAVAGESAPATNPIKGFEGLYDSLEMFEKETASCVVLIDLTDPSELPRILAKPGGMWRLRRLAGRLTALSGLDCCCFHYTQLKRDSLEQPKVKAIILRPPAPSGLLKCEAAREEIWAMVRESKVPMIAFCGGFHQVYLAYGGKIADMRRLNPGEPRSNPNQPNPVAQGLPRLERGEPDPNPKYAPGRLKEWGFCKVKVVKRDPLFEGLGDEPRSCPAPGTMGHSNQSQDRGELDMLEQHVSECADLPAEFELLASTDVCRVQAIKHKSKLLYATQFHPEAYEEGHMDGKKLLQNFFKIAGVTGNISR